MIKSYLNTAWRNVVKNKMFSLINIIGLSVGLTCCMLITLYILNETSYDDFQKNGDNIYQRWADTEILFISRVQTDDPGNLPLKIAPLLI
jgi:hypothetical protein